MTATRVSHTETPAPQSHTAPPRRRQRRLRLPFSPWHLVLIPLTFILILPLLWMLSTSL
jgi:multiple sugar transport system permease protein